MKDTLRDWCRLKGNIANLPTFQDSEQSYNFLLQLIKKNITEETLSNCDDPDDLIQVAEILMNAEKKDRSFIKCFVKVIERMISLTQSDKSKKFLEYIISKTEDLKLNFSFVEKIYSIQKVVFIEKPIADCFISYCSDQNKLEKFSELEFFWEKVSHSPILFYIVSKQLKELFLTTDYSKLSQDFIQKILNKVYSNCDKLNKDIVNLYPPTLQHCVILMRIKPSDHSEKSRNHTVNSLREIFLKDWCDTLILVSHFPVWLPDYLKFFEFFDETSQSVKSVETIIIEDDDDVCME